MEEKKITDEEIAKAILQSIEYSKTITYFDEWGNCKAIMMADVIDLIHRLHSENTEQKAEIERLTEKVENQKSVIKGQDNRIKKEKAENQRLYDEYVRLDDFCAVKGCICCICENKKTCNECKSCGSLKTEKCNGFKIDVSKYAIAIERADKLQKQVDELTIENSKLFEYGASTIVECEQAVKDTAKEILGFILAKEFEKGDYLTDDELKKLVGEKYGLEVE